MTIKSLSTVLYKMLWYLEELQQLSDVNMSFYNKLQKDYNLSFYVPKTCHLNIQFKWKEKKEYIV